MNLSFYEGCVENGTALLSDYVFPDIGKLSLEVEIDKIDRINDYMLYWLNYSLPKYQPNGIYLDDAETIILDYINYGCLLLCKYGLKTNFVSSIEFFSRHDENCKIIRKALGIFLNFFNYLYRLKSSRDVSESWAGLSLFSSAFFLYDSYVDVHPAGVHCFAPEEIEVIKILCSSASVEIAEQRLSEQSLLDYFLERSDLEITNVMGPS